MLLVSRAYVCVSLFFFFQAEDGIRDHCVTGVQTCALPISMWSKVFSKMKLFVPSRCGRSHSKRYSSILAAAGNSQKRSEERRVGKECRSRWSAQQEKKRRGKKHGCKGGRRRATGRRALRSR